MKHGDHEANRAELARERERYMSGELTFQEFYCWLADAIGLSDSLIPFDEASVASSADPYLNDLPLRKWDKMHGSVSQYAASMRLYWSLSDTVCCLKSMARRRRDAGKAGA